MNLADLAPDNIPHIETAGTLDDWSRAASSLFAPGCEAQAFALLASFASPLLGLVRMAEGGAMVSLWGEKGSGKSVAHAAAQSVWQVQSNDRGLNDLDISPIIGAGRFEALASLQTLPVLHERLIHGDAAKTRSFLETVFLNEVAYKRRWHGLMLSFSPCPLFPELQTMPYGEPEQFDPWIPLGVEFEISVPKRLVRPRKPSSNDPLAYELASNGGHAGRKFIEHMAVETRRENARRAIVSGIADMRDRFGKGDDARFQMRAIASVYVAAQIVAKIGLIEFDPERIKRWAEGQTFKSEK
jgi:hypothetical protein